MPWHPPGLEFRDPGVPKLRNLALAGRAGLRVPPTAWALAADLGPDGPPPGVDFPCFVRSGSPTEDAAETSNAGRFVTVEVAEAAGFAVALAAVLDALPVGPDGGRLGVVFVQPRVDAVRAGVTFFDGFYYEETTAAGGNQALTSGRERGEVRRGHLRRGDPHHRWLTRVHRVFGATLDLEWADPGDGGGPVLLQARPALFPVRRSETLSLANHKEILGDPPSPWMVGLLAEVARPSMGFFEAVDPGIAGWQEPYAVELAGRAWLNFSAFFRLMDRWGMPRTTVTEGVGGEPDGPLDARRLAGPLLRSLPVLPRLLLACVRGVSGIKAGQRRLDAELDGARTLAELQGVNARALEFSIRTNFAVMSLLSGVSKLRKAVGLRRAWGVVTQRMMAEYAEVAARPDVRDRLDGLDGWLARYGHRGPLESDPMRPRFAELRDLLRGDLGRGPSPYPTRRARPSRLLDALARPFFLLDELRESFRDRSMRWWQRLRSRVLEEARRAVGFGHLDAPEDVFYLRSGDLAADPATWRAAAARGRRNFEEAGRFDPPMTASRDEIQAAFDILEGAAETEVHHGGRFLGIGLGGKRVVEGTAVRAAALGDVLSGAALPESPVLVVATLEPSWGVVFPRFAAVVAELGGELSHASILLREAGIPSVVNARGAYRAIRGGDRLRVDPGRGEVRVEV